MRARPLIAPVVVILALSGGPQTLAADFARGQKLHDTQCISCHDTRVYKRDERLAKSYAELEEQVRRWQSNAKLPWRKADIDDVTYYLNEAFYHFPCPSDHC